MISVATASPHEPDSLALLDLLSVTLAEITGSDGRASFDPADVEQDGAIFAIARDTAGKAVGCGAFRKLSGEVCEIKRMYAQPGTKGVGAAVIAFLEEEAQKLGYTEAWLETRRVNTRAIRFYESHGYRRISNFGKYAGREEAVCFAKTLSR